MKPGNALGYRAGEASLLRRLLALVGLVVFLGASFAQAAHVHGDWLPHGSAQAGARSEQALEAGGEAGCPLCVSMHAAAVTQSFKHEPGMTATMLPGAVSVMPERGMAWPFALFSRPPPVLV